MISIKEVITNHRAVRLLLFKEHILQFYISVRYTNFKMGISGTSIQLLIT